MITEAAVLYVKEGLGAPFEADFRRASAIISSMQGYLSHELQRCLEVPGKYLLIVRWEALEDHTIGFRQSEPYQQWKALLHHYYDPFPVVEHFEQVELKPFAAAGEGTYS
ncbi:antibiotic biosynthesis monooxygenase family protein [Paenibacillus kobensis]|uniref:antibiotic biosynthesis monooxygenase family protein n=1 Tax=Paenibacillus kobensis TaxID=59841 RepID=UPI000FDC9808|nr:antibiotic biosynthesis monooxygenase [Paenibacillus kobensis]